MDDGMADEKVSILKDMFPNLTRTLIFEHLTSSGGQIDSAIESILASTLDEVDDDEPLHKYDLQDEESDEEDDLELHNVPLRTTAFVPYNQSSIDTSFSTALQSQSSLPPKSSTSNSANSSYNTNTSLSDKLTPTNTNDILENFEYLYAGNHLRLICFVLRLKDLCRCIRWVS